MPHLLMDKLRNATVATEPFMYTLVPGFIGPGTIKAVNATFPTISGGGSFPVESLAAGMVIKEVIDELDGAEFESAVEHLFDVDLSGRPKMYSLRGYTRSKDGQIHTDSKDKIITVLLYLNDNWTEPGGRLRLLRDAKNVDNFIAEVPPDNGTLLIFKRSETSWHGHHPFDGPRRSLQMNWMTSEGSRGWHKVRHKISATLKKMTAAE
jgi:SM-20-related protein